MTLKNVLLIIVVLIAIISCWAFYYRSSCEGCGGCGYERFTDRVFVEKITCENDSTCTIHLQSLTSSYTYQIYPGEFDLVQTDFDKKKITDTSKRYTISGNMISHGTCEPYGIYSMAIDTK